MEPIFSFGYWLKRRRKTLDLTQRDLAQLAHCSVIMIKKVEADQRRPSSDLAQSLAKALAIPNKQLKTFIECARGVRPVDQLYLETTMKAVINPPLVNQSGNRTLPVAPTPLIGRESEKALLSELLNNSWLVTIVGIGGIGKTRLALAAATEAQAKGQPVAFVSLSDFQPGDNLPTAIIEGLALQLSADIDPTKQLLSFLSQQRLLLVLDNFEHLLAYTSLLDQIHQAAPDVIMLATSRERLGVLGEQILPLGGLSYPQHFFTGDSPAYWTGMLEQYSTFELFKDHARRLLPDFELDNVKQLIELGQITGGHPLAIELASKWVDSLTIDDLVRAIRRNFDLLSTQASDLPQRHRSIRSVFDASWELLEDQEKEAFTRLSIFRGGFTRGAAEVVAKVNVRSLSTLVSRSLVHLDHLSGRYKLHELMRQYGAAKLAEVQRNESIVYQRHSRYFCNILAASNDDLKNENQDEALARIQADRANIWAAWNWAFEHPDDVPLAGVIFPLGNACYLRSWIRDGLTMFSKTAEVLSSLGGNAQDLLIIAHINIWKCWFTILLGHPIKDLLDDTRQLLESVPQSTDLKPVLALFHQVTAKANLNDGNRAAALEHAELGVSIYADQDDDWGKANALELLGTVWWNLGEYGNARQKFEESLSIRQDIGDRSGVASSLDRLGLLVMHQADLSSSVSYLQQAIYQFRQLNNQSKLADTMGNLGSAFLELGRWDDARAQYAEVITLYEKLGLRHDGITIFKALSAFSLVHAGLYDRAIDEARHARSESQQLGHVRSEGVALLAFSSASLAKGDFQAADRSADHSARLLREINQLEEFSQVAGLQGMIAYRQKNLQRAKHFIRSALTTSAYLKGLSASPNFALAAWALMLHDRGETVQAAKIYELVLAEPFGRASVWFADLCGKYIMPTPTAGLMLPEDRWTLIERLIQDLP